MEDLSRCCVHTITTRPWDIETASTKYTGAGIRGISVWRDCLRNRNIEKTGEMLRSKGLHIVSLVRGGFFPSGDPAHRKQAIRDNIRAIDQAAALGAPLLVLVCGADPRLPLETSREQIREGILSILDHAGSSGIRLAVEPLHPMYAGSRSAINTLGQANELIDEIGSDHLGAAVDVYHVWWDPALEKEIDRAGKNGKLFAFHVCDWKVPTTDLLNDRGLMGEGCIDIRKIRSRMDKAGFEGFIEVEVFSSRYWSEDQDRFLRKIVNSFRENV